VWGAGGRGALKPLRHPRRHPHKANWTPSDTRKMKKNQKKLGVLRSVSFLQALPDWELTDDGRRIRREWRVKDFQAGLAFFNRIGQLAEDEGHHPDLHLTGYRNVAVELWTHAIGGLSENDFILAAKIDRLPVALKQ
jgi:4a-hydroxytetrahydrobiopterin dehydratase